MEDARVRIIRESGEGEAACTLCKEEGHPNMQAHDTLIIKSTKDSTERIVWVCITHGDALEQGDLPYVILKRIIGITNAALRTTSLHGKRTRIASRSTFGARNRRLGPLSTNEVMRKIIAAKRSRAPKRLTA